MQCNIAKLTLHAFMAYHPNSYLIADLLYMNIFAVVRELENNRYGDQLLFTLREIMICNPTLPQYSSLPACAGQAGILKHIKDPYSKRRLPNQRKFLYKIRMYSYVLSLEYYVKHGIDVPPGDFHNIVKLFGNDHYAENIL